MAGRLRSRLTGGAADEIEFRDGVHGLLVWALATLLAGLLALGAAQALTRLAAPAGGQAAGATSVGGENIIAYDLDRLFRSDRPPAGDMTYTRAEAGRILLTASSHRGLQDDDRAYLVRLVTARTGLAQPEAERRVNEVIGRAKENIERARKTAVILAFMVGAAATARRRRGLVCGLRRRARPRRQRPLYSARLVAHFGRHSPLRLVDLAA